MLFENFSARSRFPTARADHFASDPRHTICLYGVEIIDVEFDCGRLGSAGTPMSMAGPDWSIDFGESQCAMP